jgi:hypothetical protein
MRWFRFDGKFPLESYYSTMRREEIQPFMEHMQRADGRVYTLINTGVVTAMDFLVVDLEGLSTDGAPGGHNWVQITLMGNISPRRRNSEHFRKGCRDIAPGYVEEKFPNWNPIEYEIMGISIIPFLSVIFDLDPEELQPYGTVEIS